MGTIASQITSRTIVYSTVCSGTDQRKHQSSASLAFVRGIHRGPVNSPHKGPVTRKMFPFDDVIMKKHKPYKWNMTRIQGAINKSLWHIDFIIADKSYEAKLRHPQIKSYSINSTTYNWWWCLEIEEINRLVHILQIHFWTSHIWVLFK